MKHAVALVMLLPAYANAATSYVVAHRSGLSSARVTSSIAQYVVDVDQVRAAGGDGRSTYLFAGDRAYVIDNSAHSVQIVTSALVTQAAEKMNQRATMLADSARGLPPEGRGVFDKMASDMRALNESDRIPVPRTYRRTARVDRVDGRSCHVWEAIEWQARRFEVCVAAVDSVPGGTAVLRGMRQLSRYWQGSIFALGMKLGNVGWWRGIHALHGVPVMIREFKGDVAVSETMLSDFHDGVAADGLFQIPGDYASTEVALIP